MKKWKTYAAYIIVTLLGGILVALITMDGMEVYSALEKPMLTPPAWLFPVAWTILYVLMAIGASRYALKSKMISGVYFLQLIVNYLWSVIFFGFNAYLFAFFWLLLLLVLVIVMTVQFYKVDKLAGLLQIPYILWLVFAGYLNIMVYLLNR
jgi:tryptophan-rich sensory protein